MMRTPTKQPKDSDRVGTLYHELRKLAFKHGPKSRLPTVQEMRETYGVSQATITGALDRLEAQNIVTRKDRHGIFVSSNLHRKSVRVLMDASQVDGEHQSPFWGMLWGLFVKEAQRRSSHKDEDIGFHLVNHLYRPDIPVPEEIARLLDAGLVDGVLSTGTRSAQPPALLGHNEDVPLVVFAGDGHWLVVMDHNRIYDLLIPELVARGCRKIAYWHAKPPSELSLISENIDHARNVLLAHGLSLPPEYVQWIGGYEVRPTAQRQGYDLVMEVFGKGAWPKPDGIIIGDDMITSGALAAMHRLGIMPGKDVIIGTHSNKASTVLLGYEDLLIRAEFDPAEIVSAMFMKLDLLMAGKKPDERLTFIEPRLQV